MFRKEARPVSGISDGLFKARGSALVYTGFALLMQVKVRPALSHLYRWSALMRGP